MIALLLSLAGLVALSFFLGVMAGCAAMLFYRGEPVDAVAEQERLQEQRRRDQTALYSAAEQRAWQIRTGAPQIRPTFEA